MADYFDFDAFRRAHQKFSQDMVSLERAAENFVAARAQVDESERLLTAVTAKYNSVIGQLRAEQTQAIRLAQAQTVAMAQPSAAPVLDDTTRGIRFPRMPIVEEESQQ